MSEVLLPQTRGEPRTTNANHLGTSRLITALQTSDCDRAFFAYLLNGYRCRTRHRIASGQRPAAWYDQRPRGAAGHSARASRTTSADASAGNQAHPWHLAWVIGKPTTKPVRSLKDLVEITSIGCSSGIAPTSTGLYWMKMISARSGTQSADLRVASSKRLLAARAISHRLPAMLLGVEGSQHLVQRRFDRGLDDDTTKASRRCGSDSTTDAHFGDRDRRVRDRDRGSHLRRVARI